MISEERPWKKDNYYFKNVRISLTALIKIAIHARSGGDLEVMGCMIGQVVSDTFYIADSYALPVEGTETRVNAGAQANEYMINFKESLEKVSRPHNIIGW